MKYKIGDEVRIVTVAPSYRDEYGKFIGRTATVRYINDGEFPYQLDSVPANWKDEELELVRLPSLTWNGVNSLAKPKLTQPKEEDLDMENMTQAEKLIVSKMSADDQELVRRGVLYKDGTITGAGEDALMQYLLEANKAEFVKALKNADPKKEEK